MQLDHLKRREFITLLGGALKFYGHTDGTFRGGPKRRSLTKKRCWEDSNDRQDRLRLAAHCSVSAKGRCAADPRRPRCHPEARPAAARPIVVRAPTARSCPGKPPVATTT